MHVQANIKNNSTFSPALINFRHMFLYASLVSSFFFRFELLFLHYQIFVCFGVFSTADFCPKLPLGRSGGVDARNCCRFGSTVVSGDAAADEDSILIPDSPDLHCDVSGLKSLPSPEEISALRQTLQKRQTRGQEYQHIFMEKCPVQRPH